MDLDKKIISSLILFLLILLGCSQDDSQVEEIVTLNVADFSKSIKENPNNDDSLGKINVISNKDNLNFHINSQSQESAIKINSITGELKVNDKSKFNYEKNKNIEGKIKVSSSGTSKIIDFKISIVDINEPNEFFLVNNSTSLFPGRTGHKSVVFNNKIWIIGGRNQTGFLNDIWTSENGIEWEKEITNNKLFTPRDNHEVFVFRDKIWVIGGRGSSGYFNDIWSSSDGVNWKEEKNSNFPAKISTHSTVVFNNKIWVLGGYIETKLSNTIWYSKDAINWIEVTNKTSQFPLISYTEVINFKNKLWLLAGYNGYAINDIWSSEDGVNWNKEILNSNIFPVRSTHQAITFQNKIWLIGGYNFENKALNDIWSSENGINWDKENVSVINNSGYFNPIYEHQSVIFNNKIWILGGEISNSGWGKNYVWHSN